MKTEARLAKLLQEMGAPRILVVGDMILDRYIEGRADRVSPEAPVLVFDYDSERYRLGGACNVAANLAAMGAHALVLGVVGRDAAGEVLLRLMREGRIDTSAVVTDEQRPTTRKTRYVSKTAQVLRVDQENRKPVSGTSERDLLALLSQRPFPFQAVLLSDYGKGVLTPAIIKAAVEAAHAAEVPVVADPKGRDYSRYRGVDLITPNREEAEAATGVAIHGLEDLRSAAVRLREITGVGQATITLGKDGIFFETESGDARIIPTQARQVFDVSGAGDTVVAVLTMARACGVSLHDSLALANAAAGIVVGKFGTWAVSRRELLAMLGQRSAAGPDGTGKILDWAEAGSVAARLRTEGRRLVFTNGCFDLLHPGHTTYLARARAYGDALMIGVNSDDSVRRLEKAPGRPINPLEDRMAVLAALQSVDYVVSFDEDTPVRLIEHVTPHVLAKGEDWRDKGVLGREWVESHGGQVVLVPLREGYSTTAIVERVRRDR